jgi:thioredoxin reductase (NADPH)
MNERELIIIGGGPAGLAAGLYAARAKIDVLMLERAMPGGLAANTEFIENYPGFAEGIGGAALTARMEAQAKRFGLEIISADVTGMTFRDGKFAVKTDEQELFSRCVILATGSQPQMLGVPGEEKLRGRGVSYCATCDGAFFRNKEVAVVGGGDAAVGEAVFLTRFAKGVNIIHRRGELRATKVEQQRAMQNEKIKFFLFNTVQEIIGQEEVEGVVLKDTRTGATQKMDLNGVFIYVGQKPDSQLVVEMAEVDNNGFIITDDNMRTRQPGLFAAGDVRRKLLRQVVTAVADGAIAAVAAGKYLEEIGE